MKTPLLLAVLLLAGCGAFDPDAAFPNQECRQSMYADPAVRQAVALVAISGGTAQGQEQAALAIAKQRAYNRCLRDKGLLRGGGVQPVRK
jgi:hypothetical protein